MVMTIDEIVMEYKQAKAPMKQIAILADENCCKREEIVEVLREAGVELPKIYQKKTEKAETVGEVTAALSKIKEPHFYSIDYIKELALDAIEALIEEDASDYITEQIRGIFAFIKYIERR
jgi:hypothetical protein